MRTTIAVTTMIAIISMCGTNFATAFLKHVASGSRISVISTQRIRLMSSSDNWSPHNSLGEAKVQELALIKEQEEAMKLAVIAKLEAEKVAEQESIKKIADIAARAKKEADDQAIAAQVAISKKQLDDSKLEAMMATAAAEVAEAELAQIVELRQAAVAKKQQEDAMLGAMMMAAAAEVAEAEAAETEKKISNAKRVEEEDRLAAVALKEEEARVAAIEMEAAAELIELEAAEFAKQTASAKQQEERQTELNRLAAVASMADAQERAEQLEKESSSPLQIQDMLLNPEKTPLQNILSADVVSSSIPSINGQETVDVFDIMQASAEAEAAQGSGVDGKLEIAITILAKAPLPRLRRLIQKFQPSLLPAPASSKSSILEDTILESHLKAALEALWSSSNGSWEQLMKILNEELGKQAEESSQWMKASLIAASELSETRLKALIRTHGGIDSMPKMRTGSTDKMDKTVYVAALVDILRENNENDYSKVAPILQAETAKLGGKKGFSSK